MVEKMPQESIMNRAKAIIRYSPPDNCDGENIGIAICDTGICPMEDFSYPMNRIIAFKDFVNNINYPYDDNGHGTHVSGIAASNGYLSDGLYSGIAPKSNIISLKILDEAGHGNSYWALDAINWIKENHKKYNIRVVNMSIGTTDSSISQSLNNAVKTLFDEGITVVSAAGNENHYRISSPGTSPYAITAGAMEDKTKFRFKHKNSFYYKPDIFAPSENIISTKCKNFSFDTANKSNRLPVGSDYIIMSGTSMATPMISGAAALLYCLKPNLTPQSIKRIIVNSSMPSNILDIESMFKYAERTYRK